MAIDPETPFGKIMNICGDIEWHARTFDKEGLQADAKALAEAVENYVTLIPGDPVKIIGIDPESDFQELLGKTGTVAAIHGPNDIEITIEGQHTNTFYSFAAHNLEELEEL